MMKKNKQLWVAQTEDGQKIVIKFAKQYGEAVHKLCANDEWVPELLYAGKEKCRHKIK